MSLYPTVLITHNMHVLHNKSGNDSENSQNPASYQHPKVQNFLRVDSLPPQINESSPLVLSLLCPCYHFNTHVHTFSHFSYILNIQGPKVIKLFSCLTQFSMKFFLLLNIKMPTIVGILTFVSRKKYHSRLI